MKLGQFVLDGIPPAPRGIPQIEVTFNIDVNGILNVSAKDKGTGKSQKITIQSSNLSKEEIERMKNDAETHADEDAKKRSAAEVRNEADSAVFGAEKLINDYGDKMTAEEKGKLNSQIDDLKQAIEKKDETAMGRAKEALEGTVQAFSTRLYQAAGAGAEDASASGNAAGGADAGAGTDGETVDAEFSDKGNA